MAYLQAKVRSRSGLVRSALIIQDELNDGVNLFLMHDLCGLPLPLGSSWHETEKAAKAEALDSLSIRELDWVSYEGEPEWAQAFRKAKGLSMKKAVQSLNAKRGRSAPL